MLLFNKINFIDNKILNKEYFGKFFIRSLRVDNKNIYILDNSYSYFNASISDFNKFVFTNKSKLGYSFQADTYTYKNKLNNSIGFKSYILSQKNFSTNYTKNFLESIKLFKKELTFLKYLFLTNPNKGGFICYCCGFLGLIPKKHVIQFIAKATNKFKANVYFEKKEKFNKKLYLNFFGVRNFSLNIGLQTVNKPSGSFKFREHFFLKKYKLNFVFLLH